ncbi:MAG: molybdopterin-dependent oxidoreductase [Acidobacteria bacterium]|nr:molybdopterin-dependent oxidoreductase [Acidobacteriota bacterium]
MNEKNEPKLAEAVVEDQPEVERPPVAAGTDEEIERLARHKSRRSFLIGGVTAAAGVGAWQWLRTRPADGGVQWPLRRAHEFNERLARGYFEPERLAPTFPRGSGQMPRVNGGIGLDEGFDPATWKLRVEGLAAQTGAGGDAVELTLDDIKRLPRVAMVTLLKCIEGWADMGHWAGARFADFANAYRPAPRSAGAPDVSNKPEDLVRYVSLETPGRGYYVGLDMASALHPQTLLVYEMDGQPLTPEHGAPLRLFTPVKYGIKSLKRIGTIRFTDERPADFWAERGYDWYAGH